MEGVDVGGSALGNFQISRDDVVCLCEGDPLFYGSFMYLAARLSPEFQTEVVPGVTSVSAAAAATLHPLAARKE